MKGALRRRSRDGVFLAMFSKRRPHSLVLISQCTTIIRSIPPSLAGIWCVIYATAFQYTRVSTWDRRWRKFAVDMMFCWPLRVCATSLKACKVYNCLRGTGTKKKRIAAGYAFLFTTAATYDVSESGGGVPPSISPSQSHFKYFSFVSLLWQCWCKCSDGCVFWFEPLLLFCATNISATGYPIPIPLQASYPWRGGSHRFRTSFAIRRLLQL